MRKLTMVAVVATVSAPVIAAPENPYDPDKIICRSTNATGSRIVVERICLSRGEWERLHDETRKHHEKTIDDGTKNRLPGT